MSEQVCLRCAEMERQRDVAIRLLAQLQGRVDAAMSVLDDE